jgi:hypothetical protein
MYKSERRYQGAVSHRFLLVGLVVTPILIIAALSTVKLVQYGTVKSSLRQHRQIWEKLEPKVTLFKEERGGLAANETAMDLYDGWNGSKVSFVKLLDDIQKTVPEDIQFTRLSLRSNPQSSVYREPDELPLRYTLMIQGLSQGSQAENNVILMRKSLMQGDLIGSTFASIRLASMRKHQSRDGLIIRDFQLEGVTPEGGTL